MERYTTYGKGDPPSLAGIRTRKSKNELGGEKMLIESLNKDSSITMEYKDSELERYLSVAFALNIVNDGFSEKNDDVWFELEEIKRFVKDLKNLDLKRQGRASFNSMSPDEFNLSIESYDLSGHMMLRYLVTKVSSYNSKHLSGGFELDSSCFTDLVHKFEILVDESKYPPPLYPFIK